MQYLNFDLLFDILNDIKNKEPVSTKYLALKYRYSERTIRRYFRVLKANNLIKLERAGQDFIWCLNI